MSPKQNPSKASKKKASNNGQNPLRANKMARLSNLVDDMIEPSVRKRGFVLSRLVSNWREIIGDSADWSKPVELKLDRNTHKDGVLKLSIASGRGPQAQQMTPHFLDRVNAAFGYEAVSRITLVQTMNTQPLDNANLGYNAVGYDALETGAGDTNIIDDQQAETPVGDIWDLDERLADIKSPELRAALRRFGTPVDDDSG